MSFVTIRFERLRCRRLSTRRISGLVNFFSLLHLLRLRQVFPHDKADSGRRSQDEDEQGEGHVQAGVLEEAHLHGARPEIASAELQHVLHGARGSLDGALRTAAEELGGGLDSAGEGFVGQQGGDGGQHGVRGSGQQINGETHPVLSHARPRPQHVGAGEVAAQHRHSVVERLEKAVLSAQRHEHLGVGVAQSVVLGKPADGLQVLQSGQASGRVQTQQDAGVQPAKSSQQFVLEVFVGVEDVSPQGHNDDTLVRAPVEELLQGAGQWFGGAGRQSAHLHEIGKGGLGVVHDAVRVLQVDSGFLDQNVVI